MAAPTWTRLAWVPAFLALTLLVVGGAFVHLDRTFRARLDEELGARLRATAAATAAAVDDDIWVGLLAGDEATRDAARADLETIRAANDLADLFVFTPDLVVLLDVSGQYPEGEPNPALDLDGVAVTTALAGLPASTVLYESEGEVLKSGYAPVTSDAGTVLGGVGVEATAAYLGVLAALRRAMLGAGIGVLAVLALLGFAFSRVVAARLALEERLRRAESLAGLGQMTAMMAHEIRNPLGIIRGSAETLAETHGLADDPVYRFIPEEVDRLHQTLSAYLDFAHPAPQTGRTDAVASIRRTIDLVGGEFARRGVALETDLPDGEQPVDLAARDLEQACLNLLLNARDALAATGGTVRVSLERMGNRVRIEVADDGPGMDEGLRRRAFEPFVTGKETGSGLGLAVVRRTVEGAGGTVSLESAPGKGTVVRITLPRGEEEA